MLSQREGGEMDQKATLYGCADTQNVLAWCGTEMSTSLSIFWTWPCSMPMDFQNHKRFAEMYTERLSAWLGQPLSIPAFALSGSFACEVCL